MKITHKLNDELSRNSLDTDDSIFMISKLGNYFCIPSDPSKSISNYSGYVLHDGISMFKVIENIYLDSGSGKCIPKEIVNKFTSFERLYDERYESFTLLPGGLIYDVETEAQTYINIELDFRGIHEYSDAGRIYKIHKLDDSLIVEYTKYEDDKLNKKMYTKYLLINGEINTYETPSLWIKKNYSYDESRGAKSEFYVFYALRILCKNKSNLIFTYANTKAEAMDKLFDIKKNMDVIYRFHNKYKNEILCLKYDITEVTGKEIAFGYVNSVHAIDGLMINSENITGLWAGLPWFFQYWSRDELISLKALMLEDKRDYSKDILMRHISSIMSNGRIPNIYTANGPSGLGSADAIGWLFKRIKDVFILNEREAFENFENYFTLHEIKYIRDKLQYSILQIINMQYREGLIYNSPLETWMDTRTDDDQREGYRIEIQCLFLCMLNLMNLLNKLLSNKIIKRNNKLTSVVNSDMDYRNFEKELARNVREKFFVNNYLNDGWKSSNADVSRPNIFLAYYAYPELLHNEEWEKVFDNAISRLWIEWEINKKDAGGFSTIDKENALYQSNYTGQNNKSYHRGDSWFFLNNIAALCMYNLDKNKYFSYVKKILNASTEDMLFKGFIGYSSELTSSSILKPGGCFCQTWSIATYIELIHEMFI